MLPDAPLALEGCLVDLRRRLVAREDGTTASLTAREVDLLAWLVRNPGRTITREELLVEVWGYSPDMVTRTVDNTIRRLRSKIEVRPREPRHVLTEFGEGYRFAPLEPKAEALPEGRVAVVRARVAGEQELSLRDPELAGSLERVFDEVLREVVRAHRGVVVRAGSDALVAFGEPHGAVSMALALQEALLGADWPDEVLTDTIVGEEVPGLWRGPRAAVAVGLGDGRALGDAYEGAAAERAEAMLALAHGGQVLIGPEVWRAVPSLRELGAVSTPLGRFVLQSGAEAAPVVSVSPQSLAARHFGPPRTAESRRTNLDADVNSFVGRRQLLARVHGALTRGGRLVTLRGPAGAGKTRLSRRYGLTQVDVLSQAGAGVWFADLADALTEEAVVAATAQALGVPLDPQGDVHADREQVGRALSARGGTLLILDNAEQVVDGLIGPVRAWRAAAPDCRMLVTSRQPLGLDDERIIDVEPLEPAEALALFVDRARSVRLDLELESEDLAAIAQIAERLDHNPLALELAAVRVRLLPPRRLAERLDERFRTLGRGPRDGPQRHATLDQAIGWSWDLLEPWCQQVFAQLGVFRGGFDLDAARAVVSLPREAPTLPEVLALLRERSLLQRIEPVNSPQDVRFSLLLSLREWVEQRMQELPDADRVRARHGSWAARRGTALLRDLDGPEGARAARLLQLEASNLRAAHQHALLHAPEAACVLAVVLDAALAPRGPYEDHLHLLDATLDRSAGVDASVRVPLLLARARAHDVRGDVEATRSDLSEAARLSEVCGSELRGRVLLACARFAASRGRPQEASRLLTAASAIAGDEVLAGLVQGERARLASAAGDLDAAIALGQGAVLQLSDREARREEAALRVEIAGWASVRGLVDQARGLHRDALKLARELHDLRLQARVLTWLGALYLEVGRHGLAQEHLELALELQQQVGDRRWVGICQGHAAVLRAELGELHEASRLLGSALSALEEAEDVRMEGWYGSWLASVQVRLGQPHAALHSMRDALDRLEQCGDERLLGRALARSVVLLMALERPDEARRALEAAETRLRRVGDPGGQEAVVWLHGSKLGTSGAELAAGARLEARWVAGEASLVQG